MKIGNSEFETVKSLMAMTLYAIVSDCLHVDIGKIDEGQNLISDLGMGKREQRAIKELISDLYDGIEVDFSTVTTVESLLHQVLTAQFSPADRVVH